MTTITDHVGADIARAGDDRLLADIDWTRSIRTLEDQDEGFHPVPSGIPHWTETSFWALTKASERLGGWIYLRARPALGLLQCGIYFYDSENQDAAALYNAEFPHVAIPKGQDYRDLKLENGLSLRCVEPFKRHQIHYEDRGIDLDLTITAALPPEPAGLGKLTGHLDQALWAQGTVRFGDRVVKFDDPAFRDRTWSERSDYSDMGPNYYIWGISPDRSLAIHATAGVLFGGHVHGGGATRAVKSVSRQVLSRDPAGRPERILADITCTDNSVLALSGTVLTSFLIMQPMPRTACWASVVHWDSSEGEQVTGEDHEAWPFELLRANRDAHGDPWIKHLA
jgi:hypothetical protein